MLLSRNKDTIGCAEKSDAPAVVNHPADSENLSIPFSLRNQGHHASHGQTGFGTSPSCVREVFAELIEIHVLSRRCERGTF